MTRPQTMSPGANPLIPSNAFYRALFAALFVLTATLGQAGSPFLIQTLDRGGDPDSFLESYLIRKPLKWETDNRLEFWLYRPIAGGVLDPTFNPGEFPITDEDVLFALNRAINRWNDVDSDINIRSAFFSDFGAEPGIFYLENGPFEAAFDTKNLITFLDPSNPLADGVFFQPVYYYFYEEFDPLEDLNPNERVLYGSDSTGDLPTVAVITDTFDPNNPGLDDILLLLKLKGRPFKAGELIETDIIMNGGIIWNDFPESQSALGSRGLTINDVLGRIDLEAIFAKAVGRALAIGESQLYDATLSPYWIAPGGANSLFLTNPYNVRELTLDDKTGLHYLYGGGPSGGIAGTLIRGQQPEIRWTGLIPLNEVWINEIHYNDDQGGVNQGVEVAGTAGTSLNGWSIVYYNAAGEAYLTVPIDGTLPDQGAGIGTRWFPANLAFNGEILLAPVGGVALVGTTGLPIQFLSWGAPITGVEGPAQRIVSTVIPVNQDGSTAVGSSMSLTGTGTRYIQFAWNEGDDVVATRGAVNTGQAFATVEVFSPPVAAADQPVDGIADHPIFVGKPLQPGEPLTLDVAIEFNSRFPLNEKNVGPVRMLAHTMVGPYQEFPFASPLTESGDSFIVFPQLRDFARSGYVLPGLPADNYYVLTRPRDENVSFYSNQGPVVSDEFGVTQFNTPFFFTGPFDIGLIEFFGGVDPSAPVIGDGIVSPSAPDDSLIRGRFSEFIVDTDIITYPLTGEEIYSTTGRYQVRIAEGPALTASEDPLVATGPGFAVAQIRMDRPNLAPQARTLYYDNRGRGFSGSFAETIPQELVGANCVDLDFVYVPELDDFVSPGIYPNEALDYMTVNHLLRDTFGEVVALMVQRMEIVNLPNTSVPGVFGTFTDPKVVLVSYKLYNLSDTSYTDPFDIEFGMAEVINPVFGNVRRTPLYINGVWQKQKIAFGGPGEPAIPNAVYWNDRMPETFYRAGLLTNVNPGGGDRRVTRPNRMVLVDTTQTSFLRGRQIWEVQPGGVLDGETLSPVSTPEPGMVVMYNPSERRVSPGQCSDPIVIAYAWEDIIGNDPFANMLRRVENGIARTNPREIFADDPTEAFPIPVGNRIIHNVTIQTNEATRFVYTRDDWDGDGVPNDLDNCPWTPNPGQEDSNGDGIGDACAGDFDGDGIPDAIDNCPNIPNPGQEDSNGDGIGDACSNDRDGDGIPDHLDNCPTVFNPDQRDSNGNGVGDACEGDADGDGIPDELDNCPFVFNPLQEDLDGDGIGDACDPDIDGDGIPNQFDNCPFVFNPDQLDSNGNGIGDACSSEVGRFELVDQTQLRMRPALTNLDINDIRAGDLTGNGYRDFVVAVGRAGTQVPSGGLRNRIYVNEGNRGRPGFFYDDTFGMNQVPDAEGGDDRLPPFQEFTYSIVLADFDLDGDLDMYYANFANALGQAIFLTDANTAQMSKLLLNVDVDDPRVNPFPDADLLGDGFFVDVTEAALPGVLNTRDAGRTTPFRWFAPSETRSKAVDLDGDGDPDIVVIARSIPAVNPSQGFTSLDFGYYDLEGSTTAASIIDMNPAEPFETPFSNPSFGTRILINRRNELVDASGNVLPIGTPDAFLYFMDQDPEIRERVFDPAIAPDEVGGFGRRVDKFWFRDESLGRDGLWGGVGPNAEIGINADRVPPGLLDVPQQAGRTTGNREDETFDLYEVVAVPIWGNVFGPDLHVFGGSTSAFGGTNRTLSDGRDYLLINMDVFDENRVFDPIGYQSFGGINDGRPDGYFYHRNYGPERWAPAPNSPPGFAHLLGAPDGYPWDIATGEVNQVNWEDGVTFAAVAADFYRDGSVNVIGVGGAGNAPNSHRNIPYSTGPLIFPGFSRGLFTGFGGSSHVYAPIDGALADQPTYRTLGAVIPTTDRYWDIGAADLNRNGFLELVKIGDGANDSPPAFNVNFQLGGRITISQVSNNLGEEFVRIDEAVVIPTEFRIAGRALELFDMDNDGDYDLIVGGTPDRTNVDLAQSGLHLFTNRLFSPSSPPDFTQTDSDGPVFLDATREFIPERFSFSSPINPIAANLGSTSAFDVGDINRNGRLDYVVGGGEFQGASGDLTHVMYNHGPTLPSIPHFVPTPSGYPAPKLMTDAWPSTALDTPARTSDLVFVDLDGDGDLDIFQANYLQPNRIYFNRNAYEGQRFAQYPFYPHSALLSGRVPEFYNSMARYQYFETRQGRTGESQVGFPAEIIQNTMLGHGIFQRARNAYLPHPVYPDLGFNTDREATRRVAIADIDGDGRIDIFMANGILNGGAQNVLLMNRLVVPSDPKSVTLIDETNLRLIDNNPLLQSMPFDDTWDAAFVDVNGNGSLDLILGNNSGSSLEEALPSLDRRSRLMLNDGTGHFSSVADGGAWPAIEAPVSRVTVWNFGRIGDLTEDMDGNGVVTDREVQAFNRLVTTLERDRFGAGNVPVRNVPNGRWSVPVTEVVVSPDNPNDVFVTQRPPRYIDINGNGEYDPVWDVIFWTLEDGPIYLANDGNGNFTDLSLSPLTDPFGGLVLDAPVYDADIGDIDMSGTFDIVVAIQGTRGGLNNLVLANLGATGNPVFVDRTNQEIRVPFSSLMGSVDSGPRGNARVVALFDADGDGDLDLYVGESGRGAGNTLSGGFDSFFENRLSGAGYLSRTGVNLRQAPGAGPIVRPSLAVTSASPRFVSIGQELALRITGRQFKPGVEVFFGTGITVVQRPIVRSPEVIDLRIRIAGNAAPGPRQIFVFNADGTSAVSPSDALLVGYAGEIPATEDKTPGKDDTRLPEWTIYD